METKVERKRLSVITDIFILVIFLIPLIGIFKFIVPSYSMAQNLALENIDATSKNYIESNYIKDKYGIDIIYGKNSYEYAVKVDANIQDNEDIIYNNLKDIEKTLAKYPINFILHNNLTIVILDKFNNSNIALASRNKLNEFKIYLSNNSTFERSLHHEMYHIFEYTLNNNYNNIFSKWSEFNPQNFEYTLDSKNLNDTYVYSDSYNNEAYFVTKYSKTSEKEDRAEIFAEIMTFNSIPKYLSNGSNIYKKAQFITNIMTSSLKDSNREKFYWNRF